MKDGTPGICTELLQCNIINLQLLSGTPPDTQCGWTGVLIVCCPLILQGTSTRSPKTIPRRTTTFQPIFARPLASPERMEPGVLARQSNISLRSLMFISS